MLLPEAHSVCCHWILMLLLLQARTAGQIETLLFFVLCFSLLLSPFLSLSSLWKHLLNKKLY